MARLGFEPVPSDLPVQRLTTWRFGQAYIYTTQILGSQKYLIRTLGTL